MSADVEAWPPPNDAVAFESLCLDLWFDLSHGHAQKNGRDGQPQAGVDVVAEYQGGWTGVQCKKKNSRLHSTVTVKELEDEVDNALQFKPQLRMFILATTGPRDGRLQQRARELTSRNRQLGLFDVEVWCWDDIWRELFHRKALLERIAENYWPRLISLNIAKEQARPYRTFISKLPTVDPVLIGRAEELEYLDRAWAEPATNFVQIVATGGTGKTALMDKWFRRHLRESTVFGWSFYSQGSAEDRQTSSEPFFEEILNWFDIKVASSATIYAKAEALARRLRQERVLLILDGVEPLQNQDGFLRDPPLKALLQELAAVNKGLVLCTTRFRLDVPDDQPRALSIELDPLTPTHGAEYLRHLHVEGTDSELEAASIAYGNHALALTLLGTYLVDFCEADVRRRVEIREVIVEEGKHGPHARKVMSAYATVYQNRPEASILRALGYFDRPAEPAALRLVLPSFGEVQYRAALNRLRRARLILTADPDQPIDCHPLVREHFAFVERQSGVEVFRRGHHLLYDHYRLQGSPHPSTLDEMMPLFYAIYHGCQSGRYGECLRDLYEERLHRGEEGYLTRYLGAFGTDISLLANLFAKTWSTPVCGLTPSEEARVIGRAGSTLRALGRLKDALEPMRRAAEVAAANRELKSAAVNYGNLSQLLLTLGEIEEALATARVSVAFADESQDVKEKVWRRSKLAEALHQSGSVDEALTLLIEAERLQAERDPTQPRLYEVPGYRYCELLLDLKETSVVLDRASYGLAIAQKKRRLLDIGLYHTLLGRAYPPDSKLSADHLDNGVEILRGSYLFMLPIGLLARGGAHDLDEVFRIATRSNMRLYLADYHLACARIAHDNRDEPEAKQHLCKAEVLINQTGYHRRKIELQSLQERLKATNQ